MFSLEKDEFIHRSLGPWSIRSGVTYMTQEVYNIKKKYVENQISPIDKDMFSEMKLFTATVVAYLNDIKFNENDLIEDLTTPVIDGNILMIGCNKKELLNPKYEIPIPIKKSNRGRKKVKKKKNNRPINGSGKYFESQISFLIKNTENAVNYKIKFFRNGKIQIPGVKELLMNDIIQPFTDLYDYLCNHYSKKLEVVMICDCMRNYKFNIKNTKYRIDVIELKNIIEKDKSNRINTKFLDYILLNLDDSYVKDIKSQIHNFNPMDIAETLYNSDSSTNLTIKFYRPNIYKNDKKTTLKITKRGKVNIEGANSDSEAVDIYNWFRLICYSNYKTVFINEDEIKNETDPEESDCSIASIYDE